MTEETPASGGFGVGSRIASYRLDEEIGRGGMAVVYRAYDTRLERPVALKVLAPQLAQDEGFRQRFIRESRTAAAVDHPNIIPIFEAGEAGGVLFIAMRFVQGPDLQSVINADGPFSAARACHILTQVAGALEAAHAHGLVHRDVKPGNILLDATTGPSHPGHAYLSDFGLSKRALSSSALTSTGQFLGTLDYIAPEQIEARAVDGRTDEYALACTAYTMLTGQPPFVRDESIAVMWAQISAPPPAITSRRPDLPPAVDAVLAKALAKAPAERYGTCPQFAAALRRACGLGREDEERGRGPAEPRRERAMPSWPATQVAGGQIGPDAGPASAAEPGPGSGPANAKEPRAGSGQPGPDEPAPPGQATVASARPAEPRPGEAGRRRADPGEPGPPTEQVPPVVAAGRGPGPGGPWSGGRGPAGPGHGPPGSGHGPPGPGRGPRRSRRRVRATATIAVGCVAVLAIGGALFLSHRGGGSATQGSRTASQDAALALPACTSTVAPAPQLQLASQRAGLTGKPFDVATRKGFAFVSLIGGNLTVLNTGNSPPSTRWTTPVPGKSMGETLTPDHQYLLVAGSDGISVFRVADLEQGPAQPMGRLTSPGQQLAVEVTVTPDGRFAFVTYQNSAHVGVFNLQQALTSGFGPADRVGLIPVVPEPIGITLSPDGRYVYVTSAGSGNGTGMTANGALSIIDVRTAETHPATSVRKTLPAGCAPSRVITSPDGQYLWVTAGGSNALLCFSTAKLLSAPGHALLARQSVGPVPLGLILVKHGSRIVIADSNKKSHGGVAGSLAVIDTARALAHRSALVGYLATGQQPRQFALLPGGGSLLVTVTNSSRLQQLDLAHLP